MANFEGLGFAQPTPIQTAALPHGLGGRDVLAEAPTGSGKTVAFGVPLLVAIDPTQWGPQALVLCPTRELATQVAVSLRKLARPLPNVKILVLTGGLPMAPQIASLRHGAHVVVGTPGRVAKHVRDGRMVLNRVRTLVLDEADRMLDMGFADEVLDLVAGCPTPRQTLLFSATLGGDVRRVSAAIQSDPVAVSVGRRDAPQIVQRFVEIEAEDREHTLAAWLAAQRPASALLFCNTKLGCVAVAKGLRARGIDALALHGDLEQPDRERTLVRFANGSATVLVATDVAARGLDLTALAAVVNVELPFDPEVYVHRIGRTGRAGESGLALSLVTPEELPRLHAIEACAGITAVLERAPEADDDPGERPLAAPRVTLCIASGRRDKLRPGDVLGACTSPGGVAGAAIGKIDVGDRSTYVAVDRAQAAALLAHLQRTPIKGHRRHVTRAS